MNLATLFYRLKRKYTVLSTQKFKLPTAISNQPRAFIFGVSSQINYGDLAISEAQEQFIEKKLQDFQYVEVLDYQTRSGIKEVLKHITPEDVIGISGGGNIGNLYMFSEENRRNVIQAFRHNPIISFPQSLYYTPDANGKSEILKSQHIYDQNVCFQLTARESLSKEKMATLFKREIAFTPDIVLSLNARNSDTRRDGILGVLRHDEEVVQSDTRSLLIQDIQKIKSIGTFQYSDNNVPYPRIVERKARKQILAERFRDFSSANLVITDRLHGMLFSVVTGTPCVVFNNSNGKVKYSYLNWLQDVPFVLFAEELSEKEIIEWIMKHEGRSYPVPKFDAEYNDLLRAFRVNRS